ncbi:MAG: hypothetical protein K6F05_09565, partial [Succinivibrio sp.]|nr:hypothetical protein [Succinivibrio sp.]
MPLIPHPQMPSVIVNKRKDKCTVSTYRNEYDREKKYNVKKDLKQIGTIYSADGIGKIIFNHVFLEANPEFDAWEVYRDGSRQFTFKPKAWSQAALEQAGEQNGQATGAQASNLTAEQQAEQEAARSLRQSKRDEPLTSMVAAMFADPEPPQMEEQAGPEESEEASEQSDSTVAEPADATEEAPVEDAPVDEAPAEEAPVEDAPAEEAPVEDAPVDEAPAEEAPAEEAPVEEAPVEEAPAEEHEPENNTEILPEAENLDAESTPAQESTSDPMTLDPLAAAAEIEAGSDMMPADLGGLEVSDAAELFKTEDAGVDESAEISTEQQSATTQENTEQGSSSASSSDPALAAVMEAQAEAHEMVEQQKDDEPFVDAPVSVAEPEDAQAPLVRDGEIVEQPEGAAQNHPVIDVSQSNDNAEMAVDKAEQEASSEQSMEPAAEGEPTAEAQAEEAVAEPAAEAEPVVEVPAEEAVAEPAAEAEPVVEVPAEEAAAEPAAEAEPVAEAPAEEAVVEPVAESKQQTVTPKKHPDPLMDLVGAMLSDPTEQSSGKADSTPPEEPKTISEMVVEAEIPAEEVAAEAVAEPEPEADIPAEEVAAEAVAEPEPEVEIPAEEVAAEAVAEPEPEAEIPAEEVAVEAAEPESNEEGAVADDTVKPEVNDNKITEDRSVIKEETGSQDAVSQSDSSADYSSLSSFGMQSEEAIMAAVTAEVAALTADLQLEPDLNYSEVASGSAQVAEQEADTEPSAEAEVMVEEPA